MGLESADNEPIKALHTEYLTLKSRKLSYASNNQMFPRYRLGRRLVKAERLAAKGRLDAAQVLYVSILNTPSGLDTLIFDSQAGLAEVEYRRGRLRNARYYAGLCRQQIEQHPALFDDAQQQAREHSVAVLLDAIDRQWRLIYGRGT